MTDDDPDQPNDDLAPTDEHNRLIVAELGRIRRLLKVSVEATGIPPEGHVVVAADLRGMFGRQLGEALVEAPLVEHHLRQALQRGIRPSVSSPLPVAEALPLLAMVGDDAVELVMTRPPRTVAVLVVDQWDNPAIVFSEPLDGEGPS